MIGFTGTVILDSDGHPTVADTPNTRVLATLSLSNKSALRSKLGLAGDVRDDMLMRAAWKQWGEAMVRELSGRFAFVILDHDQKKVFAAVDRMASIPIHYHAADNCLTVSTTLARMLEHSEIPRTVNRRMAADFLLSIGDGPALGGETFFESIKRIPAGHVLTFDPSGPRMRRHHQPEFRECALSDEEAIQEFRDRLTQAVERCGGPDGIAVSLSGGLDSSTVAVVAKELWDSVHLVHFHSRIDDEQKWAEMVAKALGSTVETVGCDGYLTESDAMLKQLAEPWAYDNFHHDYLLLKHAAEAGCTTLLGGYYGDVTVCESLDYLKPLADAGRWEELHEACARAAEIQQRSAAGFLFYVAGDRFDRLAKARKLGALWSDLKAVSKLFSLPFRGLFWHFILRPLTPVSLRRIYRIVRGIERPVWWEMNRQIAPAFAEDMGLNERAKRMKQAWTTPLKDARATHENLIHHDSTALALAHLFALGQGVGAMAAHPFMDEALIDFCLALPRTLHGRDGWDRWIIREAMTGQLPDAVRQRTQRTHYAATALAELRHEAEAIDAFVETWPETLSDYVARDAFLRDWEWVKSETEVDGALVGAGRRIRRTVLLGKWLRANG